MTERKPILCVDFDGVIHSYTSPWTDGWTIPDEPVPGALTFLVLALDHFDVAIYSSRSHYPGGRAAMKSWIQKWAVEKWGPDAEELNRLRNEINYPKEKPAAFLTIDDRAMRFTGTWPSPQALLAFKPWNK